MTELSTAQRRSLVAAARSVRRRAHAPYSHYMVGAAVLDDRGRIHTGCNVENASYGLTTCAERNAVAAAIAAGARTLVAVAVVTGDPPGSPCGACRQVLAEFGEGGMAVILAGAGRGTTIHRLADLLPGAFVLRRPHRTAHQPPNVGGRSPRSDSALAGVSTGQRRLGTPDDPPQGGDGARGGNRRAGGLAAAHRRRRPGRHPEQAGGRLPRSGG